MTTRRLPARALVLILAAVAAFAARSKSGPTGAATPQITSSGSAGCAGLKDNPTGRLAKGVISAQIDSVLWTATCVTVNIGPRGIMGIGGSDNLASPTIFGFGFAGSNKVGTYPVSNLALGINAWLNLGTATWQSAGATGGTGTLTFTTSTQSTAAGTFTFTLNPRTIVPVPGNTATGIKAVTKGAFNITF